MSSEDILSQVPPAPDVRVAYGPDPNQFGDLRIPKGARPHPVAMMIHGGFWRSRYDLTHAGHLCAALTKTGVATWNVEYRRVGDAGGGWPGSFDDIQTSYRFLQVLASNNPLDLKRVIVIGHSAGGHLALLLGAHQASLLGVLALAPVADLRGAWELHLSNDAVVEFLGGTPSRVPQRYVEASPLELPIAVPQVIIHGAQDDTVPIEMSRSYVEAKRKRGEKVSLMELDCGHFEPIDPASQAWPAVRQSVLELLKP